MSDIFKDYWWLSVGPMAGQSQTAKRGEGAAAQEGAGESARASAVPSPDCQADEDTEGAHSDQE